MYGDSITPVKFRIWFWSVEIREKTGVPQENVDLQIVN